MTAAHLSLAAAANDETRLDEALDAAEALARKAAAVAHALADFEIDLPAPAEADPALLRAIAGLYLAAELDAAGLIAAAEGLAALAGAGGLPFPLGAAAPNVATFWRERHQRPTAEERGAAFARLFGQDTGAAADHPGNDDFQLDMIELAEALFKLDEAGDARTGGTAQQARVRRAAASLAGGLTRAGGGLTVFLAEELVGTLRQAIAIFRVEPLRLVLGGRDTWSAVDGALRLARLPARPSRLHAQRAQSGMMLLSWLADAAPMLGGAGALVALDHPVIPAAIGWLEVSLRIGEQASATVQPGATAPQPSPWAAFA